MINENNRKSFKTVKDIPRMTANFTYAGFEMEIFGQPIPTTQQNGYRLSLSGDPYETLLQLYNKTDEELLKLVNKN